MNRTGEELIVDKTFQQIVVGTVARSFDTFTGICGVLYDAKPIQGSMLCRSLFEDVVVSHWLLHNDADPEWMVGRFLRHKEAMALYQQQLIDRTEWTAGPPLLDDLQDVRRRQNSLLREFGGEAQERTGGIPARKEKAKGSRSDCAASRRSSKEAAGPQTS